MNNDADCLIMGDINMCLINNNDVTELYSENMSSKGFILLNEELPTRITDGSESLIDHVFLSTTSRHWLSCRCGRI